MDVDSPGPPPTPSTSSATGARKRSGQPSDADSEDTIIYDSASEESSYDSDFVPVTRRKAKRRLLVASSSSKKLEPPLIGVLRAEGCLNLVTLNATTHATPLFPCDICNHCTENWPRNRSADCHAILRYRAQRTARISCAERHLSGSL
ncbi:hypothetical protein HPB50_010352 [Hyalomma asiaticum]|uniref:Uncharacterized protein n=1 Tax=Hyalomma asiaticum TaxID=266040 RepID=A0ACB7S253_HYAAI|nr:hypothetical protein HPB50_010352 [Hyalomma asiaticum]